MTGVFTYYNQNLDQKTKDKIIKLIKKEEYTLTNQIKNNNCILGFLDNKNSKNKRKNNELTKKNIDIISCGIIYDENIDSLDKKILELYENNQLEKLKNINGNFVAIIYDEKKEKITIVNDRYGSIKMFYFFDEKQFFLTPKIKPITEIITKKTINETALIDFFIFGHILDDETLIKNIKQLPYASILEIKNKKIKITRYWEYEYKNKIKSKNEKQLIEKFGSIWQKTVEKRFTKNKKNMIALSGGLDSRAILAAALKYLKKENILTITFGEKKSYDYEIAKKIAKKTGVKNTFLDIEKEDLIKQYKIWMKSTNGLIDATPYFPVRGFINVQNQNEKIILGYMGGSITGYQIKKDNINKKIITKKDNIEAEEILFDFFKLNNIEDIRKIFDKKFLENKELKDNFRKTFETTKKISNDNLADCISIWDHKYRRTNYVMNATIRFNEYFDNILPFLDNDLVDFCLSIPADMRFNQRLYKKMLTDTYPKLFNLPTKNNYGLKTNANRVLIKIKEKYYYSTMLANKITKKIIKKKLFNNKEKNYIDYSSLLRENNDYKTFIENKIKKIKKRKYFDEAYIQKKWFEHIQNKKNNIFIISLLVTFEILLEEYID